MWLRLTLTHTGSQLTGVPVAPLDPEVKGEAADFAANMCNRLGSFSKALQKAATQKEAIQQVQQSMPPSGL